MFHIIGEAGDSGKSNHFMTHLSLIIHSLHFKTKVTFGHNLRYETKGTFREISLKLRQTNWNVAIINVNVVDDELPSQSTNNLHLL
jgi:hypothetical protein